MKIDLARTTENYKYEIQTNSWGILIIYGRRIKFDNYFRLEITKQFKLLSRVLSRNDYFDRNEILLNYKLLILLVGTIGFEPTTPCPPDKCATKLRYAPTYLKDFNTTIKIKHYSI